MPMSKLAQFKFLLETRLFPVNIWLMSVILAIRLRPTYISN
jgi:hypothetical protein